LTKYATSNTEDDVSEANDIATSFLYYSQEAVHFLRAPPPFYDAMMPEDLPTETVGDGHEGYQEPIIFPRKNVKSRFVSEVKAPKEMTVNLLLLAWQSEKWVFYTQTFS